RVRAALVRARDERGFCALDLAEGLEHVLAPGDAGRVGFRADDHEVVVHHLLALDAVALRDELLLLARVVHEHHVGVASPPDGERLPGADGDHAHLDARLLLELREQVLEQPRVLGRGRGRHRDEALLRSERRRCQRRKRCRENDEETASGCCSHGSSPLRKASASAEAGWAKNRSTGARSLTRPWSRNTTSSPRRRAWPRLCVLITILVPPS